MKNTRNKKYNIKKKNHTRNKKYKGGNNSFIIANKEKIENFLRNIKLYNFMYIYIFEHDLIKEEYSEDVLINYYLIKYKSYPYRIDNDPKKTKRIINYDTAYDNNSSIKPNRRIITQVLGGTKENVYENIDDIYILLFLFRAFDKYSYYDDDAFFKEIKLNLISTIRYRIQENENSKNPNKNNTFLCIMNGLNNRILQFSGTCWLSATLNTMILSEKTKNLIMDTIKYKEFKNKNSNINAFKDIYDTYLIPIITDTNIQTEIGKITDIKTKYNKIFDYFNTIEFHTNLKKNNFNYNKIIQNLILSFFYLIFTKKQKLMYDDDNFIGIISSFFIAMNYIKLPTDDKNQLYLGSGYDAFLTCKYIYDTVFDIKYKLQIINDNFSNNLNQSIDTEKEFIIISYVTGNNLLKYNNLHYEIETAVLLHHNNSLHGVAGITCCKKGIIVDSNNFVFLNEWKIDNSNTYAFVLLVKKNIVPVTPAAPAPVASAPVTPTAPVTFTPIAPAPTAPVASAPVTPAPVTPAPVTFTPIAPAPSNQNNTKKSTKSKKDVLELKFIEKNKELAEKRNKQKKNPIKPDMYSSERKKNAYF